MKCSAIHLEIESILRLAEENVAIHPGYADLRNELGLLYAFGGDLEKGIDQLQEALRLNPLYLEARINLAFLHIAQRQWEQAETVLKECLRIDSENSLCYHALGIVQLFLEKGLESAFCLKRASSLSPFYRSHYERMGILDNGKICLIGAAKRRLKRGKLNQHLANTHSLIGQYFAEMGETERAIREFRKASRMCPNDIKYHLHMGKFHDLQGRYRLALQEFERTTKICPEYGMAYAHMSYAYASLGDLQKALALLKKAVKLHPGYADLHYQLGLLYGDQGMDREALNEFLTTLKINPRFSFARINLGFAYETKGQLGKALKQYEKAARMVPQDRNIRDRIVLIRKEMEASRVAY